MRNFVLLAGAMLGFIGRAAVAQTTVVHAGTLVAEPGKPVRHRQSIVIENGRVTAIRDGYVAGDVVIDLSRSWVLPGLIDMHTHVTGPETLDEKLPDRWATDRRMERQSIAALDAVPILRGILTRGFTTIRNVGDPAGVTYDLRDAIAAGKIEGPRMLVSEPQFNTPGEYARFATRLVDQARPLLADRGRCSGVDDCRRAVREEIARAADVIKLRLSDLVAEDPRVIAVEYPEEIGAIVDTAHRLGRTIAVHTSGNEAETMMAVVAGADTIEHGPLGQSTLAEMKRRGTAYTPTLYTYAFTAPILRKLGFKRDFYAENRTSVALAKRMSVRIIFGTDLLPLTAPRQAAEFKELVDAGLTPTDALMSATVNAAAALHMEDEICSIAPGKAADIVAVDTDPLADITSMERVSFVMKAGKRITR